MTEGRGASNAKAKRELQPRQPRWSTWRDGFRHGLTDSGSSQAGERQETGVTRKADGRGDSETFEKLHVVDCSRSPTGCSPSVTEAEDVVQEAFFVRHQAGHSDQGVDIASPKAYLSTVVTRLSHRPAAVGGEA